MKNVVCLNGNMPVQDTFAPLATELHGDVDLVLKDREAYSRAPGEGLTLADEVEGVRQADELFLKIRAWLAEQNEQRRSSRRARRLGWL